MILPKYCPRNPNNNLRKKKRTKKGDERGGDMIVVAADLRIRVRFERLWRDGCKIWRDERSDNLFFVGLLKNKYNY